MRIEMKHIEVSSSDEQRAYYFLRAKITCALTSSGIMIKSTDVQQAKSILEDKHIIYNND